MDAFDRRFGDYNPKKVYALDPAWLSLFNSLIYIGFAAAANILPIRDRGQILAAQILNYVYVVMELAVVPTFQSEIVPTQVPGLAVGSYQFSIAMGDLIGNSICCGTSNIQSDGAWRIPLGLFYVIPTIILL
ncbi:hypothetical protein BBP40_003548 [Aspergillus hancockii]|nr:hypothetical protein BBP40_003548 [Aspergillus hancockii]